MLALRLRKLWKTLSLFWPALVFPLKVAQWSPSPRVLPGSFAVLPFWGSGLWIFSAAAAALVGLNWPADEAYRVKELRFFSKLQAAMKRPAWFSSS